VRAFEQDMHGSVALVADTSAAVTGTAAYGPFGEPRVATGESSYLGFQADPTDPITGMVDLGARLYDPAMGRFSTQDVVFGNLGTPVSLNQYVYGSDSPVSNSDPSGMCTSGPDGMDGNCGAWSHPAGDQYQYWHPVVQQGNDDPMRDANGPGDWSRIYGGLSSVPPPRPAPPKPVSVQPPVMGGDFQAVDRATLSSPKGPTGTSTYLTSTDNVCSFTSCPMPGGNDPSPQPMFTGSPTECSFDSCPPGNSCQEEPCAQ
jgi:RHS repeat-associated protein